MAINKQPKNASGVYAGLARRNNSASFVDNMDHSLGNSYPETWLDNVSPGVGNEQPMNEFDSDNQFRFGGAVRTPVKESVTCHLYPNANMVTQTFFVNPTNRALRITGINAIFTTAGSVAGASAYISHECTPLGATTQQAPGTGPNVMGTGNTFNLHGTAATLQAGAGPNNGLGVYYHLESRSISVAAPTPGTGLIVLQPGDSLSIVFAGTLTTLVGLTITLFLEPGSKYHFVSYYAAAAASSATLSLMTAMRPRTLLFGAMLVATPETATGTLTLNLTKDASGTVPGAGTAIATALSLKGTANTYTQFVLSSTAANLSFNSTDSVAVLQAGSATPTAIAGVCVTLAFSGNQDEVQIDYNSQNSTVGTNEEFWIADRDYQVLDIAGKWSHTSASGTVGLTADTGTQTPSTGQVVQTDNTNAGFLTSGTINVPVFGTLAATNKLFLRAGDRLGLVNAGTLTSLAGVQISARLRAM